MLESILIMVIPRFIAIFVRPGGHIDKPLDFAYTTTIDI